MEITVFSTSFEEMLDELSEANTIDVDICGAKQLVKFVYSSQQIPFLNSFSNLFRTTVMDVYFSNTSRGFKKFTDAVYKTIYHGFRSELFYEIC